MIALPLLLVAATAGLVNGRLLLDGRHRQGLSDKRADDPATTTLADDAIQLGSFQDGSEADGADIVSQVKSLTSQNNFINYCAGKILTNGIQIASGSCNGIPMGDLPAKSAMISSIITFPLFGSDSAIEANTTFNISIQVANLAAGSLTNPSATYYSAPQQLLGGLVLGHVHVTIQNLGDSLYPEVALDATQFDFFKGINNAGDGKGLLQATVTGGLPAGNYRVCTIATGSNHQAVQMPMAQRGGSDDCTRFIVSERDAERAS